MAAKMDITAGVHRSGNKTAIAVTARGTTS
jgi:hypothetical protein